MNATSLAITARRLPPDSPEQLKFSLAVDASALTLAPTGDGGVQLNVAVGVCTFDKNGLALKLMNYPMVAKLNAKQYGALAAAGKVAESIFVPGPKPAAVRLLVLDVASGREGSVHIDADETSGLPAQTANAAAAPQPRQ